MIETLLWLIIALTGFNVLGGLIVGYWCWLCGSRAEHALQAMQGNVQLVATKATHIEANARYTGFLLEHRYGHADEMRRQQLLQAASQQCFVTNDTAPLPIVRKATPWIGDQAMRARRAMCSTDPLILKEQSC